MKNWIVIGVIILCGLNGQVLASQFEKSPAVDDLIDVVAPTPSNGDVVSFNSTSGNWENAADRVTEDYILIRHEVAAGTNGGACTAGTFVTRQLNIEVVDTGNHATLAANQVTLLPGTYRILASAPAYRTDGHIVKWRNVTDATDVIIGTNAIAESALGTMNDSNRSWVSGRFTIATTKVFELQHFCVTSSGTTDFGAGIATSGTIDVYAVVELWREGSGPASVGAFSGALVRKTANQSLPNNAVTVVTFDAEEYDTDNWHDNAVNNSRLTVPSGVTRIRACASGDFVFSSTGTRFIELAKNGVLVNGSFRTEIAQSQFVGTCSGVLSVVAGDFFELRAFQNSGAALNLETSTTTWFSIEAVP